MGKSKVKLTVQSNTVNVCYSLKKMFRVTIPTFSSPLEKEELKSKVGGREEGKEKEGSSRGEVLQHGSIRDSLMFSLPWSALATFLFVLFIF